MKLYRLIILILTSIILTLSCDHNVYIDDSIDNVTKKNIWCIGTQYFETANEAISYIISNRAIKTDDASRTITLMRPVLAENSDGIINDNYKDYIENDSLRGSIIVPESFSGDLCIDFNGYRYDFSNKLDAFFKIEGGSNVYIYNGTSVIFNEASHEPYAFEVNSDIVTIDEHLLDDRRTNSKAINVKKSGNVAITSSNKRENTSIKGAFNIDGKLSIENGIIYIDSISTSTESTFSITGGEIHNPHECDSIVLPALDNEDFKKNDGEHVYIHEWSTEPCKEEIVEAPSCIKEGLKRVYYRCTGCDATTCKDIVLDKIDHDHSGSWITTDGTYHWRVCPVCSNEIDKAEHLFTVWSQDSDSIWHRHCTVCKRAEEDSHITHKLVHHPYKAATCLDDGNIEYWECSICGLYFSDKAATNVITKDLTILPHHTLSDWAYDIDSHWKICNVDGKVFVASHSWGNWQEHTSGSVTHLYTECSICGARKVAQKPEYLVYNIGIGEVELKNIEDTPCGDFYINGEIVKDNATVYVDSAEVVAEFRPYQGSNTNYTSDCTLYINGSKNVITGEKDSSGNYKVTFILSNQSERVLDIQLKTEGGSLGLGCYIYLKK